VSWINWIFIVLPFPLFPIAFVFSLFSTDFLSFFFLSFFNWISSVFLFSSHLSFYACELVLLKRRQQQWRRVFLILDPSHILIYRVITLLQLTMSEINDGRLKWGREKSIPNKYFPVHSYNRQPISNRSCMLCPNRNKKNVVTLTIRWKTFRNRLLV
jgi:hypothetical protein